MKLPLIGLLTAVGADAPEISSALVALFTGARDVGVGVILGSNSFNLAALVGVSAVLAVRVAVPPDQLKLHGGAALVITLVDAAFIIHVLSAILLITLLLAVFVPYLVVLALRPHQLARLPGPLPTLLAPLVTCTEEEEDLAENVTPEAHGARQRGPWRLALLIVGALGVIVAGSIGLVRSTLTLADAWGLPHDLVGVFVLAGLTGLPNAYAAGRLALRGRGAEVVSEAFNSNTINLLVGIGLPALVIGLGRTGRYVPLDLAWLLGLTVLVLLLARQGGLSRWAGAGIVGMHLRPVRARARARARPVVATMRGSTTSEVRGTWPKTAAYASATCSSWVAKHAPRRSCC